MPGVTEADVRRVATSFAHVTEQPHHGIPSWRTSKRIFATLPDGEHLHVMLDEGGIRAAVAEFSGWCEEKWWGRRLAAVRVHLPDADPAIVAELLGDAWQLHS
ncbi:MAG: hypothetical protein QOK15_2431 [Nocardioidaceae bacterium]|nr:hypothetical protein [Nocardioidaceae bacterium]